MGTITIYFEEDGIIKSNSLNGGLSETEQVRTTFKRQHPETKVRDVVYSESSFRKIDRGNRAKRDLG